MRFLAHRPHWISLGMTLVSPLLMAAGIPASLSVQGQNISGRGSAVVTLASAPRATVLAFVSSKCPCSASHELELKRLAELYQPRGFRFVGIHANQDETPEDAKKHFEITAFPFPVIHDEAAKLADELGALKTPHVFVIDPQGKTLYQGGVDDSHLQQTAKKHYLAEALQAISEGKAPEPATTRTLGCVISRNREK